VKRPDDFSVCPDGAVVRPNVSSPSPDGSVSAIAYVALRRTMNPCATQLILYTFLVLLFFFVVLCVFSLDSSVSLSRALVVLLLLSTPGIIFSLFIEFL